MCIYVLNDIILIKSINTFNIEGAAYGTAAGAAARYLARTKAKTQRLFSQAAPHCHYCCRSYCSTCYRDGSGLKWRKNFPGYLGNHLERQRRDSRKDNYLLRTEPVARHL